MLPAVQTILLFVFPALLIVAALYDAVSMTIPNWISAALIAAFVPAALVTGLPLAEAGLSLAVGVGALILGIVLFALRWVGGGDAKLIASASLWLGVSGVLPFLAFTALAGGVLALVLISARRALALTGFPLRAAWAERLFAPKGDLPYGIAIAAGGLLAFPESSLMAAMGG